MDFRDQGGKKREKDL